MAKIAYSKFGCKINTGTQTVVFNDNEIEVKQYLPIDEKLKLIARVIEISHEENYNYSNPVKREAYFTMELIYAYSNITFTEKQKEDFPKLFDAALSSGLVKVVLGLIPETEINVLWNGVEATMKSIYDYQNSIAGLLSVMKEDYSAIDENLTKVQEKIKDPENLQLVKDVLTKLN